MHVDIDKPYLTKKLIYGFIWFFSKWEQFQLNMATLKTDGNGSHASKASRTSLFTCF